MLKRKKNSAAKQGFQGNPGWVIFRHAYERIWSGWGMSFWEILFMTIAAAYLGMYIFHITPVLLIKLLFLGFVAVFILVTPLLIGFAIYRSHVSAGLGDEAIRVMPIKPYQILLPRMAAAAITWLQMAGPLLIAFVLNIPRYGVLVDYNSGDTWFMRVSSQFLAFDPDYSSVFHTLNKDGNPWVAILITALFILQAVGLVTLPITWGFLAGNIHQKKHGNFLMMYFSYLLFPLAVVFFIRWDDLFRIAPLLQGEWEEILLNGLGGVLLSIPLFYAVGRTWSRRLA